MTKRKHLFRDLSESELRGICGGHPPGGNEFDAFGTEPLLKNAIPNLIEHGGFDAAIGGIRQGFVEHAPTCAGHPNFH